jgi:hypothetical protein
MPEKGQEMTEEGLQKKEFVSFICGDKLPDSANEVADKFFATETQDMRIVGVNNIEVTSHLWNKFPPVEPSCAHWRVVKILFYKAQESQIADYDKIKQELSEKIENLVRSSMQ